MRRERPMQVATASASLRLNRWCPGSQRRFYNACVRVRIQVPDAALSPTKGTTMSDDADLARIVYDFVTELPNTIKNQVLTLVVLYAMAYGMRSGFEEKLEAFLLASEGPEKFSAVLRTIAALDYILASRTGSYAEKQAKLEFVKKALPESKAAEVSLLALPFAHKHFELALAKWQTLRDTTLSLQILQDFEGMCLNPLVP